LDFYFREPPEFDEKARQKFLTPSAAPHLAALSGVFAAASSWQAEPLESALKQWVESSGLTMKDVAQPVRVALTGRSASPPLFDVMSVLGREKSLSRLARAAEIAQGG
jgi:glutamyl-tRNA synthetase